MTVLISVIRNLSVYRIRLKKEYALPMLTVRRVRRVHTFLHRKSANVLPSVAMGLKMWVRNAMMAIRMTMMPVATLVILGKAVPRKRNVLAKYRISKYARISPPLHPFVWVRSVSAISGSVSCLRSSPLLLSACPEVSGEWE